jgi:hypothetical protein
VPGSPALLVTVGSVERYGRQRGVEAQRRGPARLRFLFHRAQQHRSDALAGEARMYVDRAHLVLQERAEADDPRPALRDEHELAFRQRPTVTRGPDVLDPGGDLLRRIVSGAEGADRGDVDVAQLDGVFVSGPPDTEDDARLDPAVRQDERVFVNRFDERPLVHPRPPSTAPSIGARRLATPSRFILRQAVSDLLRRSISSRRPRSEGGRGFGPPARPPGGERETACSP